MGFMAIPSKPCEGKLSELTLDILRADINRAKWGTHPCQVCGQIVGVVLVKDEWLPETHWPSVTYKPRKESVSRVPRSTKEPLQ
jgi:hypothetical protein